MSQDTFESRFNRELDLLNENRLTMGLKKISQARIAEIIIYDKDISFASKKSLLNQYKVILNEITNTQYIPIGEIENLLDELFNLHWSTSNFQWQIQGAKIIGSINLTVVNPVTGGEITRVGAGGFIVSGNEFQFNDTTIIIDIETAIAALKSECIKNAAKSLGNLFGRDINRGGIVELSQLSKVKGSKKYLEALKELESISDVEDLKKNARTFLEKWKSQISINELSDLSSLVTEKIMK